MTYNLLNGAVDQFNEVIEVVKADNPDFLTLNEASDFDTNNNKKLIEFAQKTNFSNYHLARCGDSDNYHVAVLSKLPFKATDTIKPLARAGILVVIDTPLGEIAFVGTHLTPYSEDLRIPEAKLIIEKLASYQNSILTGDLNSLSPEDGYSESIVKRFNEIQVKKFTSNGKLRFDVMKMFAKHSFVDTAGLFGKQRNITAPTSLNEKEVHSNMRLDYILVSKFLKDKVTGYEVVKNRLTKNASDHYPVVIGIG